MKTCLLVFCLTTLLSTAALAAEKPPPVELSHQSSFDAEDARNPFWPIGWKKPGPKMDAGAAGPALSPEAFALTSVTMGAGPHYAILNGKILQEGEQFGLQIGTQVYQVTLRTIEDGQVVLAYPTGEVTVPLRRH